MMKHNLRIIAVLIIIFAAFGTAHAATTMEIGIPGQINPGDTAPSVPEYIKYLYLFVLGFVGIAGFASIVFWGAVWTASGVVDQKSRALEGIKNALYGIGIAFGAYIILFTINPDLTVIKLPNMPQIQIRQNTRGIQTPQQIKQMDDTNFCSKLGVSMCIASNENGGGNGRCGVMNTENGKTCASLAEAGCSNYTDQYQSCASQECRGQKIIDCDKQSLCQWMGGKCILQ